MRVARTVADPNRTSRLVPNGKASSSEPSRDSAERSRADRGPKTPNTAYALVTSMTLAWHSSGSWRRIQSTSRSVVAACPVVATAQTGSLREQVLGDRRPPQRAGRLQLTVGPRQGVLQPQHLAGPGAQPVGVARQRREPAQVRADEVHGRTTLDDPF